MVYNHRSSLSLHETSSRYFSLSLLLINFLFSFRHFIADEVLIMDKIDVNENNIREEFKSKID